MNKSALVRTAAVLRSKLQEERKRGKIIGFVPTMGFLHEGHASLIRSSARKSDITVVSIYVNPTQFGPQEDFSRYPRDLKRDMMICREAGADLVFAPADHEMYPLRMEDGKWIQDQSTWVEETAVSQGLCGASRTGHFQGVCTVVAKLFNMVQPDLAFFGQKDAQQCAVIRRMVRDLNFPIRIIIEPTTREPDGLAMSSRNSYLSKEERSQALCLHQALLLAKDRIKSGEQSMAKIRKAMHRLISKNDLARIDYIEIVDPDSLSPLRKVQGSQLVILAVYLGKTRLIDNMIIKA